MSIDTMGLRKVSLFGWLFVIHPKYSFVLFPTLGFDSKIKKWFFLCTGGTGVEYFPQNSFLSFFLFLATFFETYTHKQQQHSIDLEQAQKLAHETTQLYTCPIERCASPKDNDVGINYFIQYRNEIRAELLKHGAIWFRGFDLMQTVSGFRNMYEALGLDPCLDPLHSSGLRKFASERDAIYEEVTKKKHPKRGREEEGNEILLLLSCCCLTYIYYFWLFFFYTTYSIYFVCDFFLLFHIYIYIYPKNTLLSYNKNKQHTNKQTTHTYIHLYICIYMYIGEQTIVTWTLYWITL